MSKNAFTVRERFDNEGVGVIKNGRLGQCTAVWLEAKVRDRGLGLPHWLYAGSACDDIATGTA